MKVTINDPKKPPRIKAEDMEIGQLGLGPEGVLLRAYNGWVLLNNPKETWTFSPGPTYEVDILKSVTLEVE